MTKRAAPCSTELDLALTAAETWPKERLPELLGELERIRFVAQARLFAAAPAPTSASSTDGNDILTVKQAAKYAQVSASFLYRNLDTMPTIRIGNAVRFRRSQLDQWFAQHYNQHKAAPGR
jgi:excisionase family DNA binding protein